LEGRISKLPLDKGNKLKEGSWEAYQVCGWYVFFKARGNKRGKGVCEKKPLVLTCERRLFMEKMCANKEHGRKLCVANSCNEVHEKISMNKHVDSYLK
jgi:hypothetical protein